MSVSLELVELDATQKRLWIETRSALLWICPAFTHILFSMLNPRQDEMAAYFTTGVDVAATDGENLIINPVTYFKYSLGERVFIGAHEIMHNILNHIILSRPFQLSGKVPFADGTSLPYDHKVMNVAMDLVINDALVKSKIGTMPNDGWHDPNLASCEDNFVDAYRKVYVDQEKKGGKGGGGGGGSGGGGKKGFDQHLPPGAASGKDPGKAAQDRSQPAWDAAVAGAINAAKLQGKLPAALERLLGEVLEPKVSWQEHIRAFLARRVGNSSYNWRKPDKRFIQRDIFTPSRSGHGCGDIVVAVDTSGSIGQTELNTFFAELRGILEELRPSKVHLVWCDAKVHKVDELESVSDLAGLKPKGGGGTDFRPVFRWVDEQTMRPDALVYFTDMLGDFPKSEPEYPVVWGDIYGRVKAPFGELVHVPMREKKK